MGRKAGWWVGKLSAFGTYLKTHEVPRDALAAGVGITGAYVSMLAHGKATPGLVLARRIETWTRANVFEDAEASKPIPFTCFNWELKDVVPNRRRGALGLDPAAPPKAAA